MEDLTFDIFSGRLLQESARRQVAEGRQAEQRANNTSGTAFRARYPMRGRNIGGQYGLRRGGIQTPNTFGVARAEVQGTPAKAGGASKAKGKCFYCEKDGH